MVSFDRDTLWFYYGIFLLFSYSYNIRASIVHNMHDTCFFVITIFNKEMIKWGKRLLLVVVGLPL